ncbi:MAG: SDR family oxidoreductase [Myxococcales bacterium]|nr:SDR family oxidoreductase [Myxococcales bacterium]
MRPLSGKVALVTGGGHRLGRAIAEGLGALGADVAVHFHASKEGALAAAQRVQVDGNRAQVFQADLSSAEAIELLVAQVEQALGPIAVLVNSAALYERHDFLDTPRDALERQWALNARAPFLLTQAVARGMRARGGGDVVNVVDIGGAFNVWRHYSAYTMTKAALTSLTHSLALELAPQIRVNAVAPGTVLPPQELDEATREALRAKIPAGEFGAPADVVAAVQFLVTGPRFITGQVLAVDGGRHLAGG